MSTYYPNNDNKDALDRLRESVPRRLQQELEAIDDIEEALENGSIAVGPGPIAEQPPALAARWWKDEPLERPAAEFADWLLSPHPGPLDH